jgi:hypothetical protein
MEIINYQANTQTKKVIISKSKSAWKGLNKHKISKLTPIKSANDQYFNFKSNQDSSNKSLVLIKQYE